MKLLACVMCDGELDIVSSDRSVNKKVKCKSCGFTNSDNISKGPEVIIVRRRNND
jgi:hypothetical protein